MVRALDQAYRDSFMCPDEPEPIFICVECGFGIFDGESCFTDINDNKYCMNCRTNLTTTVDKEDYR